MSETNFTKGEWYINQVGDCNWIDTQTGLSIAQVASESDTHLIAAAPELYKMLSIAREKLSLHMVDVNGDGNDFQDLRVLIDNLLAKARGEQQ